MKEGQKKWLRGTSLFLVLVLFLGILPMQSFAAELKESAWYLEKTLEASMPEAEEKKVAPVVGEAEEKRTENEKHFRLEDGTFAAAIYETPVHYRDETGAWQQIDNTLVAAQDTQQRDVYENKESSVKVQFAKESGSGELVKLVNDKGSLSWSLADKGRSTGAGSTFEVQGQKKQRSAAGAEIESDMAVSNITSEGIYRDIMPDVDLQYIIKSNIVKENIILNEKGTSNSYTFAVNHEGLGVRKEADGSVTFYQTGEGGETAFVFAAPFAVDADGVYTDNAAFTIEEHGGTSLLTIAVDKEWLEAKDRAYPVVIDPYTKPEKKTDNIQDTYVSDRQPNVSFGGNGSFLVGKNDEEGINRGLVKFNNLPKLEEGSIIYDAYLDLVQYEFSANDGQPFNVGAYEPTGGWNERVTWNSQPGTNQNALDYVEVKKEIAYRRLNITKLVRQWYNTGVNNGVMVKSMAENKYAVCRMFSSNYPYNQPGNYEGDSRFFPGGVFCYKNATGLEDYWSYHQQSAGTAGTGHTNDFNGNLTMVHDDAATSDPLMSAAVSHVYNLTERGNAGRFGNGWSLSVMQQFVPTTGELAKDFPYYYRDADGTKHYFYNDNGTYKDEDGLGMVYNGIDEGNLKYKITLKDKTVLKFDVWNNLYQVIDTNGNNLTYNYGWDAWGNVLGSIVDSTGKSISFQYTNDEHRSKLTSITDEAGRQIHYSYDGSGNLTQITYPDGTSSKYAYEWNQLVRAESSDGYRVEYQYTTDMLTPRVSKITEKDAAGNAGQQLMLSYRNGCTTVFDDGGADGNLDSWQDNNTTVCNFDTFGRLNDMYDQDSNAISAEYCGDTSGAKKNKLQNQSKMNKTAGNLLSNGRVESHRNDSWYPRAYGDVSYYVNNQPGVGYDDAFCFSIGKSTEGGSGGVAQDFSNLNPGKYTLSGYVKVDGKLPREGAGVMLETFDSQWNVTRTFSKMVASTDATQENGWQRVSVTAEMPAGSNYMIAFFGLFNTTGKIYFDNMQLEAGSSASAPDLLNNGSFEHTGVGGAPYLWNSALQGGQLQVLQDNAKFGKNSLLMSGEPGKQNRIYQTVDLKPGKEGDVFTLSGWAKGNAPPKGAFRLAAAVIYENHPEIWHTIDFDTNITDWQYGSLTFSTDDNDSSTNLTYVAIHVYLFYEDNTNEMRFDGLQLLKDSGQSYVYNDKGDLVNAKDAADSSQFSYDGNSNLKSMTDVTGTSFSYNYDSKNNLTNASNSDGLNYKFTYDSKGNALKSTISSTGQDEPVAGQSYYLRQKKSAKYLSASGGTDQNGTPAIQYKRLNALDQKWRIESVGGGYYKFITNLASGRALDVDGGKNEDGRKIQIYDQNDSDAQKFKLVRQDDGGYLIYAKCSGDTKVLTNEGGRVDNMAAIELRSLAEGYPEQIWYFEPASFQTDEPQAGKVYELRNSYTGQYLDAFNNETAAGTRMLQYWYNGGQNQRFRLADAGAGSFYVEPQHAPGMVVMENEQSESGYPRLNLQAKTEGDNRQKFRLERNPASPEYYLVNQASGRRAEVLGGVFSPETSIVTTTAGAGGDSIGWVLEECTGEVIQSSSTYVEGTNKVASQTDARGNVTTNQYTAGNRLLSSVTAGGNTTGYTYDANTDQLTSVSGGGADSSVKNTYAYDKGKLSSIGHNGFNYNFTYDGFGRMLTTNVGDQQLVYNVYNNLTSDLIGTGYKNGGWVNYFYDQKRNLTQKTLDNGDNYLYTYDSQQNLTKMENTATGKSTNYLYDFIGRPLRVTSGNQVMNVSYDTKNRVSRFSNQVDSLKTQTEYVYGEQNKGQAPSVVYGVKVNDKQAVSYGYDQLIRMNKRTLNTTAPFVTEYGYAPGAGTGQTTTLVDTVRNGENELRYTYDASGNILTITENGVLKNSYTYDALNQLTEEVDHTTGVHQSYTYDNGGNLLGRASYTQNSETGAKENQNRTGYSYTDPNWKDKLTNYNGQPITYDAIGNPLTYRDGMSFTWQNGRRLKTASANGKNLSYAYNDQGIRTQKTVDGVTTEYYLNGSAIYTQVTGSTRLDFLYDDAGDLLGFLYNGRGYYYVRNGQNDITGILNSDGTQVVAYTYDAWGTPTSTTGTEADTIGSLNPFRYRGYYYDAESSLYYLNSRYYDPQVGRFINADSALAGSGKSVQGFNLFQYCFNNPINMTDETGHWPKWVEKVAKVVAVAAVIVTAVVLVAVVVAGTGGLALGAAAVAFGTACGGLVGGMANQRKGRSFTNGWIGGAANGFIQSVGTAINPVAGTIIGGGIGSGAGTAITEALDNRNRAREERISKNQIVLDSLKSAAVGSVMSIATAGINTAISQAVLTQANGLMPTLTPGFGEMMKGFFSSLDDAFVYLFTE